MGGVSSAQATTPECFQNMLKKHRQTKVVVIGATQCYSGDVKRWGEIDRNFIGISHEPDMGYWKEIGVEVDWNIFYKKYENYTDYFISLGKHIGTGRYNKIFFDRGTLHHVDRQVAQFIKSACSVLGSASTCNVYFEKQDVMNLCVDDPVGKSFFVNLGLIFNETFKHEALLNTTFFMFHFTASVENR